MYPPQQLAEGAWNDPPIVRDNSSISQQTDFYACASRQLTEVSNRMVYSHNLEMKLRDTESNRLPVQVNA